MNNTTVGSGSRQLSFLLGLIITSLSLRSFASVLVITAAPYIQADLQVSVFSISILLSAFPLGVGAGQLLFGTQIDRFCPTQIYMAGPLILIVACVLSYIFSSSIVALTILFFIQAIGFSATVLAERILLFQLSRNNERRLARYYSLECFSYLFSETMTPFIFLGLLLYFAWPSIFVFTAVLASLLGISAWKFIYNHPLLAVKSINSSKTKFSAVLFNANFINYTLIGISAYVWVYIYYIGVPYSLKFIFQVSDVVYGAILTACLLAAMLAALFNIYALRSFPVQRILIVSAFATLVLAGVLFVCTWLRVILFGGFCVTFIATSFSATLTYINAFSLALFSCPKALVGKATSIYGSALAFSGFVSGMATGYILALDYDDLLSIALYKLVVCAFSAYLCWRLAYHKPATDLHNQ